ncbi:MAG: hypothetical protein P1V35_07660 [Planctomycetota bacterium]|nr:hypothetical protein [Planctomycetota bacterium]
MSFHDDIIRRWLDEAAADAAPKLDRESIDGLDGASDEEERMRDRLRLVQGLLSTLDLKEAPKELDALVHHNACEALESETDELQELELAGWLEGLDTEPVLEPCKAPEFLDRIVEQRLATIQGTIDEESELQAEQPTRFRWGSPRRMMAGATLALVLLAAPLFLGGYSGADQDAADSPVRLVNYDSLEGLQRAFPSQSQVASGVGILGAFGASGNDSGGPR